MLHIQDFCTKAFLLNSRNNVLSNVRKCCKIVSLVKNVALWHLFVIFLMSSRESFVFLKTYFFPRCLTRLILDLVSENTKKGSITLPLLFCLVEKLFASSVHYENYVVRNV